MEKHCFKIQFKVEITHESQFQRECLVDSSRKFQKQFSSVHSHCREHFLKPLATNRRWLIVALTKHQENSLNLFLIKIALIAISSDFVHKARFFEMDSKTTSILDIHVSLAEISKY
jgi:hypothetical protein